MKQMKIGCLELETGSEGERGKRGLTMLYVTVFVGFGSERNSSFVFQLTGR
jgi:hypothetical protein